LKGENVVLIRLHQNGENLAMDDSWVTPSQVHGNRVTLAASFITKISSDGITSSTVHVIDDGASFLNNITQVLSQV
jgi:hypothetical protein